MQGFLMNSRRPLFQDLRVRQALGLAFDFNWTNKSLFYDQYTRSSSFFSNSYLAATGLPSGLELSYLEPFRENLPKEVFITPLTAPDSGAKGGVRTNLRKAKNFSLPPVGLSPMAYYKIVRELLFDLKFCLFHPLLKELWLPM